MAALAAGAMLAVAPLASAHDIPRDVTVRAFARPQGQRLRLLIRAPLKSMTDVEFPRREHDYVDLTRVDEALGDAARVYIANQIDVYEGAALLPPPRIVSVRMSVESDRSFASYDDALAHVTGPPLSARETLFWEQGLIDVLLEYAIRSEGSDFSIDARFDRLALHVVTALRFLPPGGMVRAFELEGNAGLVRLDPRRHHTARRFVGLGFLQLLGGADHLLFLLCLVLPFRRIRALVPIVTAFTIAYSVTLLASAGGYAPDARWFRPLVEALMAISIVYMALENIVVSSVTRLDHRWVLAFGFGLVHGFGFSFGLQHTLQFAGSHLVTSLLSFNVGVEVGLLLVLCLLVPLLDILFRLVVAERVGMIVLSAIAGHTAWHWAADRLAVLRMFPWPAVTAAGLASGIRWLMLVTAIAVAYTIWRTLERHWSNGSSSSAPESSAS